MNLQPTKPRATDGEPAPVARDRHLAVDPSFSLATTCGPVAWARGRWPNVDWIDGALVWVGWEADRVVDRIVRQDHGRSASLEIAGSGSPELDVTWARATLGLDQTPPVVVDAAVQAARRQFPGLRPWANGSLFEGFVGSIVGQSISVAAAAVTETRLAALFHDGMDIFERRFRPLPRPDHLASAEASLVRRSGVTWRRAEALVLGAQAFLDGHLPSDDEARANPDAARVALRALPLVGPWTAESALLWGLGDGDAFPPGDAALLRAARLAYDRPELDHAALNALAATWSPHRGWAARWLWTALLGPAPAPSDTSHGITSTPPAPFD
ncbi:MAG: DNA-3-methyladenine glycosylase [Thermomicrobiales bacterium]|nr:DNA-3-methyladenine glycosylase [Thermomicrobiales bacterium]